MINFLEQLAAEWYEFRGYFVRRNIRVGLRPRGGYESELDVVAFDPDKGHLVHIEASMDADSWAQREKRFTKKFEAGTKYIPGLFKGFVLPEEPEKIALFVFGTKQHRSVGGGRVLMISELMEDIRGRLASQRVDRRLKRR
jgi:hypothetical protein